MSKPLHFLAMIAKERTPIRVQEVRIQSGAVPRGGAGPELHGYHAVCRQHSLAHPVSAERSLQGRGMPTRLCKIVTQESPAYE